MMTDIIREFKLLAIETEGQVKLTHGLLSSFSIEVLEEITNKDDYIDNLKTSIENGCFSQIYDMQRSPDLAPLNQMRALHIIAVNLERIADFCVNIARQTQYLTSKDFIQAYDYRSMFLEIQSSLTRVTRVFDRRDLSGALNICRTEFKLDDQWEENFAILLEDLKRGREVTNLVTSIFIFRYLERIGDSLLNIGEALIFAIMGDRIKIRQVEALEKTLTESGFKGSLGDIDFASIWGSRSGCRISKVSRKKPSGFMAQGIFKEGKIAKIQRERTNIMRWEKIYPGLAPRVFGYYEKYQNASMLVEFLSGCTLDQVILTEKREIIDNVIFVLEQTLVDIWNRTLTTTPVKVDYMEQLMNRLSSVMQVHPAFFVPREDSPESRPADLTALIRSCRQIETTLEAPFTVFIHGDFNTNNIVYNHDEQKINYIDLHRSRDADYVQDASVFLVSNFRMSEDGADIKDRLNGVNRHFIHVFRTFAAEKNDDTHAVRMALALARSFITSTRFEFKKNLATQMTRRACILMQAVVDHQGRPWQQFELPREILAIP